MTSNIAFSRDETIMTMDLDVLSFSGLSEGESLTLTFSVEIGQATVDSWTATYYADGEGTISLSALGRMWNRYLIAHRRKVESISNTPDIAPDKMDVAITYTMEDGTTATCHRYLLYSRRRLVSQFGYLPFLSKVKHSFADAKEPMSLFYSSSDLQVSATAIYVRNGVQSTIEVPLSMSTSSPGGSGTYVSPSVIAASLPSGARLMEYTVALKRSGSTVDRCRYILDRHNTQRTQMVWLNRWGVYETLTMLGTQTLSPDRTAEYGWAGDDWTGFDMEVKDEYEISTGYVGDDEWNLVRDLAESPVVWLWNGLSWQRVTVTGVKLSRSRPTNEARACTVKYRLSDREAEWF